MNETYHGSPELLKGENVLLGTLGALLGSLIGGLICILLMRIGFIAGISGYAGFVLVYIGYLKFSGAKSSIKGIVITVIISVTVLVSALHLAYANIIIRSFEEVGRTLSLENAFALISSNDDLHGEFLVNLILLLVFTVFGCFSTVRGAIKQAKADKNPQPAIPQTQEPWTQPESSDKE